VCFWVSLGLLPIQCGTKEKESLPTLLILLEDLASPSQWHSPAMVSQSRGKWCVVLPEGIAAELRADIA